MYTQNIILDDNVDISYIYDNSDNKLKSQLTFEGCKFTQDIYCQKYFEYQNLSLIYQGYSHFDDITSKYLLNIDNLKFRISICQSNNFKLLNNCKHMIINKISINRRDKYNSKVLEATVTEYFKDTFDKESLDRSQISQVNVYDDIYYQYFNCNTSLLQLKYFDVTINFHNYSDITVSKYGIDVRNCYLQSFIVNNKYYINKNRIINFDDNFIKNLKGFHESTIVTKNMNIVLV